MPRDKRGAPVVNVTELIGFRAGRLTVIAYEGSVRGLRFWKWICDCTNVGVSSGNELRRVYKSSPEKCCSTCAKARSSERAVERRRAKAGRPRTGVRCTACAGQTHRVTGKKCARCGLKFKAQAAVRAVDFTDNRKAADID